MTWFFLSSGLFLGWSLGANDAANLFGTAVGTRMVRFATAAFVASVFVVLGAVTGGAGTSGTLDRLGSVDTLPGAFAVAFAAALSVFLLLRRIGLPVSTSQTIVGAIVGWNLFTGRPTNATTLLQILSSWVVCPLLAAGAAAALFLAARSAFPRLKIHLLEVDAWTRAGLLVVGAFGAFSLGQNNIANVMGVFVRVSPFPETTALGPFRASSVEMLFLLGGLAIAAGIYTYSHRVMRRVGEGLTALSPLAALVVVLAASIVLFLFASPHLARTLKALGLPVLPLVPVSSSQAVVGAILGISLVRGSPVKPRPVAQILLGWAAAPLLAMGIAYLGLAVLQNVFRLPVTAGDAAREAAARSVGCPCPAAPGRPLIQRLSIGLSPRRGARE
jgi:PiT family inorganic phosphate transporter